MCISVSICTQQSIWRSQRTAGDRLNLFSNIIFFKKKNFFLIFFHIIFLNPVLMVLTRLLGLWAPMIHLYNYAPVLGLESRRPRVYVGVRCLSSCLLACLANAVLII